MLPVDSAPDPRHPPRYLLRVCRGARRFAVIQVLDRYTGAQIVEISGDVARHLIESGVLAGRWARSGERTCDKSFVWHLLLASAAAQRMVNQMQDLEAGLHRTLDSLLARPPLSSPLPVRRAAPVRSDRAPGRSAASGCRGPAD